MVPIAVFDVLQAQVFRDVHVGVEALLNGNGAIRSPTIEFRFQLCVFRSTHREILAPYLPGERGVYWLDDLFPFA
jgi:hypothetical protein